MSKLKANRFALNPTYFSSDSGYSRLQNIFNHKK